MIEFRLNNQRIEEPEGWDGMQFVNETSAIYFGNLFGDLSAGNASLISNDEYVVSVLSDAFELDGITASVYFDIHDCGKLVYSAKIDFLNFEIIGCCRVKFSIKANDNSDNFRARRTVKYGLEPNSSVYFNGKYLAGKSTHKLDDANKTKLGSHFIPVVSETTIAGTSTTTDRLLTNNSASTLDLVLSGLIKLKLTATASMNYEIVIDRWNNANLNISSKVAEAGSSSSIEQSYSIYWTGILNDGDYLTIRLRKTGTSVVSFSSVYNLANFTIENTANVNKPKPSNVKGIYLKDAFDMLLNKMETDKKTCSKFFDSKRYWITNGYNLRGVDKPVNVDFEWLFNNLSKIFCLGAESEKDCIRIEQRKHFEDCSAAYLLEDVENVTLKSDAMGYYKSVNAGYNKWQSDIVYGTDEFNSQRGYHTQLVNATETLSIVSELIAGHYLIEKVRQSGPNVDQSDIDESIFIVCVSEGKAETFTNVSGVIDPTNAYNVRISPARIVNNWKIVWADSGSMTYISGEGNDDMTSDIDGLVVLENENKMEKSIGGKFEFEISIRGSWDIFNDIDKCVSFRYCGKTYTGRVKNKTLALNIIKANEIKIHGTVL